MTGSLYWWQTRWFVALAAIVSIVPLLWPAIPPLIDLPGHIGRYSVQLALHDHPELGHWYRFQWALIGNLGIDLLIIPLAPLVGLEPAVKLLVIAIPALTTIGLLWVAREAHGRVPPTALFALPLAYSYPFQFGFVNYALAMALALNLFALWLRLARTGRLRLRGALFVPLSCLLWVCHAFGWGVFGVLAFCAEIVRQRSFGRRWMVSAARAGAACLPLALPMALMLLWRLSDGTAGATGDWLLWNVKLGGLTMVLRDRWAAFDIGAVILLYLLLFKSVRDREVDWSRALALAAIVLLALFVAMPRLVFGSAYADMRLAPYMLAVALIAMRPKPGETERRSVTIAALGLAFFLARTAGTTASFWLYDRSYDRVLSAIDHIPVGARVVSFVGRPCDYPWAITRLEHLPAMALVRRRAFSNDQWSIPGAQLMTPVYTAADTFGLDPSEIVTLHQCPGKQWLPIATALRTFPRKSFDYVWLIDPPAYDPALLHGMTPTWRNGTGRLLKVERLQ